MSNRPLHFDSRKPAVIKVEAYDIVYFLSIFSIDGFSLNFRYLSTGMTFIGLGFSFRMAHNTFGLIIVDTCKAVWDILQLQHMPFPSEETFSRISDDFFTKWNIPNCFGCNDGIHVKNKCPEYSGLM
jgi:hypothetical protein